MPFFAKRTALFAIAGVFVSLLAQSLWISNLLAQTAVPDPGQEVKIPISQLDQIQLELQYFRARDAERQAREESVAPTLPISGISPVSTQNISSDEFSAGLPVCDGCPQMAGEGCLGASTGCKQFPPRAAGLRLLSA